MIEDSPIRRNVMGFSYSVWTPNTQVMLTTVPWSNDYRDIVKFDDNTARMDYLKRNSGPFIVINNTQYLRANQPIKLDIPFGEALRYNYMRVYNPAQPIGGDRDKAYFYFILDVRHIAPNTTEFVVQLDTWQTFGVDMQFGRCYVERGHVGIANKAQYAEHGRRFLAIPEGFDAGSDMMIVGTAYNRVMPLDTSDNEALASSGSLVVIVSSVDLDKSGGTKENPELVMAAGDLVNRLPSGAFFYLFDSPFMFSVLLGKLADTPWITSGIMGIYVIPQIFTSTQLADNKSFTSITVKGVKCYKMFAPPRNTKIRLGSLESQGGDGTINWLQILEKSLPKRYRHLKKFLTSEYSSIQLSVMNGAPLIIKPELMRKDTIELTAYIHSTQPTPRIAIVPTGYNGNVTESELALDYRTTYNTTGVVTNFGLDEGLDFALVMSNFPQVPILNNSYISFMASNANQVAYNYESASWSQQRALAGNNLAFNQATASMGLSNTQTGLGVNARNQSTALANETLGYKSIQGGANAVVGGVASAMGGNIGGGVLSGAMGVANAAADYAIGANQNSQSNAISNNLATSMNEAAVGNVGYVRDTNKQYSDYAAQGDYANTIAGLNAKVQDAKMLQPTVSGQFGGDAFNYVVNRGWLIRTIIRRIDNASIEAIGEYWLRYGYAVNRFHMVDDLQVMENFTYWKMHETNLLPDSKCPEAYRVAIRGIFEKGVTVWRNPSHINGLDIGDNKVKGEGVIL